ncbi:unnamed protein product [Cuscuta europaea]|uniref:DUF7769 domain-containing protein n=1 Tax=Cuscuta europaea TaxID=41803 RepID=A0A9P1A218_CUSEU|nr:unnamed protein product [Cuscuta europaea]
MESSSINDVAQQPAVDPVEEEDPDGEPVQDNINSVQPIIDLTMDPTGGVGVQSSGTVKQKRPKFSFENRRALIEKLLAVSVESKLQRDVIRTLTTQFKVSTVTIHKLWSQTKQDMQSGHAIQVEPRLKGNVGRKRISSMLYAVKIGTQKVDMYLCVCCMHTSTSI